MCHMREGGTRGAMHAWCLSEYQISTLSALLRAVVFVPAVFCIPGVSCLAFVPVSTALAPPVSLCVCVGVCVCVWVRLPARYVPILPMVLVNGSEGIGTGWSSSVPTYNPRDIVANLKALMAGEEMKPMQPWYRGFRVSREDGEREREDEGSGVEWIGREGPGR